MSRKVYTPWAIAQMRALAVEGKSSVEIAQAIGSTPGSVQVKCSQLRISLLRGRSRFADANDPGFALCRKVALTISGEEFAALKAAAQKRGMRPASLIWAVMVAVMKDDIIDAVLDADNPNAIDPDATVGIENT